MKHFQIGFHIDKYPLYIINTFMSHPFEKQWNSPERSNLATGNISRNTSETYSYYFLSYVIKINKL